MTIKIIYFVLCGTMWSIIILQSVAYIWLTISLTEIYLSNTFYGNIKEMSETVLTFLTVDLRTDGLKNKVGPFKLFCIPYTSDLNYVKMIIYSKYERTEISVLSFKITIFWTHYTAYVVFVSLNNLINNILEY